jgi:ubiquitin-protein ligase E3 C
MHSFVEAAMLVLMNMLACVQRLTQIPFSYEEQQLYTPSGKRALSKRQIAYLSPRLGVLNNIPFAIPFDVRVSIFRHFVASDRASRGDIRTRHRRGNRVRIRRGNVAEDGFDKLGEADLKNPIEITFIDQFDQEEYVRRYRLPDRRTDIEYCIGLALMEGASLKSFSHRSARKYSTPIVGYGL